MTKMSQSPSPESGMNQNTSVRNTRRKSVSAEKLAQDYPSFLRQTKNPLSTDRSRVTSRAGALSRLGLVEKDLEGIPRITPRVREAVGSTAKAITLLEGDDSADSITFLAKWNSISEKDRKNLHLEDIITAVGLTTRRFMELLAGATYDHGEMMTGFYKAQQKLKVLKSAVKAATTEPPIVMKDTKTGEETVIGHEPADVKAMELFFKITGDIKPSGGVVVNSNNQTANINPPPERDPLQSMDKFLIELDEVRKPKQLHAPAVPVIPVEMPEGAPEIEYLSVMED